MTNETINLEQIAIDNGYTFSHKGCPCSGTPLVYRKTSPDGNMELSLYIRRGVWTLKRNHYIIDRGTSNVLHKHLQQWD